MRVTIPTESPDEVRALLGINDGNARLFRRELNVAVILRKGELQLDGDEDNVATAQRVVEEVIARYRRTGHVDDQEVELLLGTAGKVEASVETFPSLLLDRSHRSVVPRTLGQQRYVQALSDKDVVFAIGPAGTGKTYLAVAMAVRMLRDGNVKKIVLTRPAIEAGEKLGYLPGTFEAKVNPYMRPLYDALYDLVDPVQIRKFAEGDVLEIAPLAYMRGRTLSDAFIILDEGQNTTPAQMKMFLTRMGERSRMVVTGDITQVDLPPSTKSGLVHVSQLLRGIGEIGFCHFDKSDIIRHPIVQKIVEAYELESDGDGR